MISEYEDLRTYLSPLIPPTQVDYIINGFEAVRTLRGDIVLSNISLLIAGASKLEQINSVDEIRYTLFSFLEESINQYGVYLDEDNVGIDTIPELTLVLRGLIEQEDYEYPDEILTLFDVCQDSVELVTKTIALVTGEIEDAFTPLIAKVSEEYLIRVCRYFEEQSRENTAEIESETSTPPDYFKHPLIAGKVDYAVLDAFKTKVGVLTLPAILRAYGNRIADLCQHKDTFEQGLASWLFVLFVAKGSPQPSQLFALWETHFLDGAVMLDTSTKLKDYYQLITGESK